MTKVKTNILIGLIFWISEKLLFPRNYYFLEISILVLLVPSDADGDGDDGGGVPTTLPAWQVPRGYHAQG